MKFNVRRGSDTSDGPYQETMGDKDGGNCLRTHELREYVAATEDKDKQNRERT